MYRVGATFDEIFEENVEFLVRIGALHREGDRLRPGAEVALLGFLAELLRPYLEAYRIAAATALEAAASDRKALLKESMERGRGAWLAGGIALREAVSKATVENAIEWLVSQGLLAEEGGQLRVRDRDGIRAIVDGIAPLLAV
jgi:glycerol-3-phosphate O-acyltransferase